MPSTFTFEGEIAMLEIARGHDGFLRGSPEPVLVFATYMLTEPVPQIVGRTLHRFRATKPFPSEALADKKLLPSCSVHIPDGRSLRWAALAIALEEDGGEDVQRVFGAVEHHQSLSVLTADPADVEPRTFASLPAAVEWSLPREVDVLIDGQALSGTCHSDKWIGAVCWLLLPSERTRRTRFRLPFLAPNGRNDWTAVVEIGVTRRQMPAAPSFP
jgi:hypothetical protein